MQAIGPFKTSSPEQTAQIVAHYFAWIDGKRPDPPAPPRQLSAAVARAVSPQPAARGGLGSMRRRRCLCISIEDARTTRQQPASASAAARAAASRTGGPPTPPGSANAPASPQAARSTSPAADRFIAQDTPPGPGNQNRMIAQGPREDRPIYPAFSVAALDAAGAIFDHPETAPPPVKS